MKQPYHPPTLRYLGSVRDLAAITAILKEYTPMTDVLTLREMQAFAATILEKATAFQWSLQGFGMFRLYLSKDVRLHIWDDRFRVADVTDWHTHPWHFDSTVLCGNLRNERAKVDPCRQIEGRFIDTPNFLSHKIHCGEGGGLKGEPTPVRLDIISAETYFTGQSYHQRADEIHRTTYTNGTITVCKRQFLLNTEEAYVYYPIGTPWVSAEPRRATEVEVMTMRELALVRLKECLI